MDNQVSDTGLGEPLSFHVVCEKPGLWNRCSEPLVYLQEW